jgi:DNA-binding HxlR family transcriptional regulator
MTKDDHDYRSACSIARTLDLLGDRWTLLIIRDLLWHGKRTFRALQSSAEGIPSNLLTQRLRKLEDWGLVQRKVYQDRPIRHSYHLTEQAQALEPLLIQMMSWGHAHLGGGHFDPATGRSSQPDRP